MRRAVRSEKWKMIVFSEFMHVCRFHRALCALIGGGGGGSTLS